jgi:hypothetical protein
MTLRGLRLTPRNSPWLVYAIVCAVGLGLVGWRGFHAKKPSPVIVVAARPLPSNTQLAAQDLALQASSSAKRDDPAVTAARAALVGRYLKSAVDKGAVVTPAMGMPAPDLTPPKGLLVIGLPSEGGAAASAVNAGTPVIVCAGDKQIGDPSYVVRAKICTGGVCTAYLHVSPTEATGSALAQGGLPPRVETASCLPHPSAPASVPAKSAN